ncbi:MAG: polysaccharide biosynthesis C-terminal domain-containing protein [Bacteroidetes bacterium]|nr:polysaccharide biosynthesis C-terminal domain-containing protein [Bacteroidota bacterium]
MILRKILGTSGSRILHAASNLLLLWLATNKLGSEAWGLSGLILLDISLLLLIADMIGNALVFFSSRRNTKSLLKLSYFWIGIVVSAAGLIFYLLHFFPNIYHFLIPKGYGIHILLLVLLNGFHGFNMYILLGKDRTTAFNSLFIIQFITMLLSMAGLIYIFNITDERAFVYALYASYIFPLFLGYLLILSILRKENHSKPDASFSELFRFGSMTQLSSIAHMLNKRLSFYFINQFTGLSALGIYNSGSQLTEGLRMIGQSIALVQISSLSNSDDRIYAKVLSLQLLKFSVILTTIAIGILALIPSSVFEFIFSSGFGEIRVVIISLSPGVVALAANAIFSHYFSGTGRPVYNLYASLVGLGVTIPAVFILIPAYGLAGAGAAASIAYTATVIYQWFVFKKDTGANWLELLISKNDILTAWRAIKNLKKPDSF